MRTKGWVVLAIPVLTLCLGTLLFYLQGDREKSAVRQVQHSYDVMRILQRIDTELLRAESSVRGFLVNGNQDTLAEFTNEQTLLPSLLTELRTLVADNSSQLNHVTVLDADVAQRLSALAAVRDASLAAGTWPSTIPAEIGAQSLSARENVTQSLAAMQTEEQRLLDVRSANEQTVRSRVRIIIIGIFGLGLFGSLATTRLFTAGIVGRVDRLAENADRLADGQELQALPQANDEIGLLAERLTTASLLLRERETALAHERDLLRALMDNIPYPVFFKDRQSRYIRVNKAMTRAVGLDSTEAFVGTTDFDYLPAEQAERLLVDERALLETGVPIVNRVTHVTLPDGEARTGLDNLAPIIERDGTITGTVGSSADITELTRAGEARARLAAIVTTSSDAIVGTDLSGAITSWNPGAEHLYGFAASDAIGREFAGLVPSDSELELATAMAATASGFPTATLETTQHVQSGQGIAVSLSFSPVYNDEGTAIGSAVIARDISALKQAEADLREAIKELEAFTYSVSHDLRAPLRAMNGFSRILLEDYDTEMPADARHFLQLIQDNARQMGQLVDDLLAFSRLGRQQLTKVPVALDELARDVVTDLQSEWTGRQVSITVDEMPTVDADPGLMRQVFANLIGNAIKFTRTRDLAEITIESTTMNATSDDEVVVQIRDNGVGFDMTYAHKLFGVFQRLHRAEDYEGTGVGLALVQRIVHRHGGRIWAEASVDHGATFWVALPTNPAYQRPTSDAATLEQMAVLTH